MVNKGKLMLQNNASRTQNVTKNLMVGIISKAFLLVATFVTRTLFIRILGAEYTGISSLYSNILSLLNLAELGFGSVLTYELYKPLRDNDEEMVTDLVALFKNLFSNYCCRIGIWPFASSISEIYCQKRFKPNGFVNILSFVFDGFGCKLFCGIQNNGD